MGMHMVTFFHFLGAQANRSEVTGSVCEGCHVSQGEQISAMRPGPHALLRVRPASPSPGPGPLGQDSQKASQPPALRCASRGMTGGREEG